MTIGIVIFGVLAVVVLFNLLAFLLFYLDKQQAVDGGWRVPERVLLLAAFLGGSIGAKIAQRRFRHKTRKQPFRFYLDLIVALHIGAIALMAYPPARLGAADAIERMLPVEGLSFKDGPKKPRRFGPGSDDF